MVERRVKILGSGAYLPKQRVSALELDSRLGLAAGTTEKISGVQSRYFRSGNETVTRMAAEAIRDAVRNAGLELDQIDLLVSASFSFDQPLPYKAALIQSELGLGRSGLPCYDVDATCLSFVVALDTVSYLVESGRYKNVVIVSSEASSAALNWKHLESASLFGDGAVAVVVGPTPPGERSSIFASRLETYSVGVDSCQIVGGGAELHSREFKPGFGGVAENEDARFLFSMDGREAFRLSREKLPGFIHQMLDQVKMKLQDFDRIIPHQASVSALKLLKRQLEIRDEQWVTTVQDYGNMIAASIPYAFHLDVRAGHIKRGDRALLIGTSAGLSIGAVAIVY